MALHSLRHLVRLRQLREEGETLGNYPGARSARRSLSTWIMGAGLLLVFAGFAGLRLGGGFRLAAAGVLVFVIGLAVAVVEALLNK